MRSSRAMERAMAARARWGGERRSRARARRPRGLVAMRDGVCARCRRRRCRRERSRAVDAVRVDGWWRGACVAVAMGWRWGGARAREGDWIAIGLRWRSVWVKKRDRSGG